MLIKQKVCSYHLGRKVLFRRWILEGGVCGERLGRNSVQCTKCQRWVHRRYSDVPRQVSLLSCRDIFVCRTCLGHNFSVVEKLEFKTGEDVLEEVEKFCYLGDMISCFGGASEAVSARIGSAWKNFRELSGVLVGKQGLSLMQQLFFGAEKDTNTCLTRMTFGFLSPNSKIILISNHGVRMYNQLVILQFLLGKQYFYLVNHLAEAW